MTLRKLIRLLLKIPATPFVLAFLGYILLLAYICYAVEWIYETDGFDSKERIRELKRLIKKWFTNV